MATEKKLIDANALKEKATLRHGYDFQGVFVKVQDIDAAPTVDAVEVVRCKDCKHFVITKRTKSMFCDVWCTFQHMGEENYCSHGERKDND